VTFIAGSMDVPPSKCRSARFRDRCFIAHTA
jgi:hypothetical protein